MPDGSAGAVNSVKQDIGNIIRSGDYYVTPELSTQLRSVENGLNHLSLHKHLLHSSSAWQKQVGDRCQGGLGKSLANAKEILASIKGRLDIKEVSNMQSNQIRDANIKAMQDLMNLKGEILPYTCNAKKKVDQFSDHIGTTDRYTGYRSNLTRGTRDPFTLDSYWMKELNQRGRFQHTGSNRGISAPGPQLHSFKQYQTSQRAAALQQELATSHEKPPVCVPQRPHTTPVVTRQHATKAYLESCGINTTYPGPSEYMTRYNTARNNRVTSDFTINPSPDFLIYGRPIARKTCQPAYTEYNSRYEWPDGNKITPLPWMIK